MKPIYFILIVIGFIAAFILFFFISTHWRSEENNISTAPSKVAPEKQKSPNISDIPQQKERRSEPIGADFVYPNGDDMRDVFQRYHAEVKPRAEGSPPPPFLILTGVIYKEPNPIAILADGRKNSYLAKVNDTVLDFTVKKIEPRSVILKRGSTEIELKVFTDKEILKAF